MLVLSNKFWSTFWIVTDAFVIEGFNGDKAIGCLWLY